MNYLKRKDSLLSQFYSFFKYNSELLRINGLRIHWFGYGGRDDDYIQIDLENDVSKIKITLLFWINLFDFNEKDIYVTYFCYVKQDKKVVKNYFENKIFFKDLGAKTFDDKMNSVLNEALHKYKFISDEN